jgi:hypothetical protein
LKYERYEVLTAAPLRIHHYWDMALCCSVNGSSYSEGRVSSLSRVTQYKKNTSVFLTAWPLKIKTLHSFQMLETTHSATQCHIPEDLNPQIKRYSVIKRSGNEDLNQM